MEDKFASSEEQFAERNDRIPNLYISKSPEWKSVPTICRYTMVLINKLTDIGDKRVSIHATIANISPLPLQLYVWIH